MVSAGVRRRMAPAATSAPTTGDPGSSTASCAAAWRASACTSPSALRMPVSGENSAATACTCGSRAATKARSTRRSPSTPLASPLALMASSVAIPASSCATMILPQRACGTPKAAQNS